MMKYRYTLFCTFRPLLISWTSGGRSKLYRKFSRSRGGCQNIEIQGHLLSSGHHKNSPSIPHQCIINTQKSYINIATSSHFLNPYIFINRTVSPLKFTLFDFKLNKALRRSLHFSKYGSYFSLTTEEVYEIDTITRSN